MVSFVILHYKNINDTIECIESIKKLDKQDEISIVVVDNNSLKDNELEKIQDYTKDIILSEYNLGVAKAYNLGSEYAIKKYKPDFVCVLNNDTLVLQENFVDLVNSAYSKYQFDALGPKIESTGGSVNPFPVFDSLKKIENRIERNNKLIKIYSNTFKASIFEFGLNVKSILNKPKKLENGKKEKTGCALHGCFIVFSKKYYKKFKDLMLPHTFLFHEEEYLYFRFKKYNLVFLYYPKIEILHKDGQALKTIDKNIKTRKLNKLKEANKSLETLKNMLINDDDFR